MTDPESRIARVEQRMDSVERQVGTMVPLVAASAVQAVMLENMTQDLSELRTEIAKDRERYLNDRREDSDERREDRHWLIGTIIAACVFIVGALSLIVSNL